MDSSLSTIVPLEDGVGDRDGDGDGVIRARADFRPCFGLD